MAARTRPHARSVLVVLAVLLLAAWLLPRFFSAEPYRRRLGARLELTLGRRVTFGTVSLHLLPRPGFSLEDVLVREDPAFGTEPFVHAGRVDCSLQLRDLWRGRLDCARLRLEGATLNIVRGTQGEWNVQQLLLGTRMASPAAGNGGPPQSLDLEADDARLNFKIGGNKKPLAVTDLTARLIFDPQSHRAHFQLAGSPVRTDLSLPTPGPIDLMGDWAPGPGGAGHFTATLQTRGTLVFDWVPLLTGRNPGIYGVLDADIHLSGSYPFLEIGGQGRITQMHRWSSIPPSDSMPVTVEVRCRLDRSRGRALIDAIDASFANSRVRVTGAVDKIPDSPELDVVVALERSRLEDLLAMARRLWGRLGDGSSAYDLAGAANGLLTVNGPWADRRYGGFATTRDVKLKTPSGTFPVTDMALHVDDQGVRLAPVRITVAPRVEVVAEGIVRGRASAGIERTEVTTGSGRRDADRHPHAGTAHGDLSVSASYELTLSAKSVPLHDLLRLARDEGVAVAQEIDARGPVTADLRLAGSAWPFTRPALSGDVDLRAARLVVPGLAEPIVVSRARIEIDGNHVTVDPLTASVGTTVFAGQLEHSGARERPWTFDLHTGKLSWDEGAAWFDALGRQPRFQVLEYIPGLQSLAARRSAGASLFGALNAKGRFAAATLSYRSLTLSQLTAQVEISGRMLRASSVTFKAAGGLGRGGVHVDLTVAPAKITGSAVIVAASVQTWADYLPPQVRKARGLVAGSVQFQTRGLSRPEMSENLEGEADVQVKDLSFGDFDPLAATVRAVGWETLVPERTEVFLRSADASLTIANGRVSLNSLTLPLSGAQFVLAGTCGFDGAVDFRVRADFGHVTRRWSGGVDPDPAGRVALLHLAGPINRPAIVPGETSSRANR